ncbi:hypothetical protein [Tateyamaria sp. Alg231-49]|uniref:hypothetical protein n=1 Tax=Tateyamaria sp. Alg231-49 TaxID=1922219 RepID=UPI000D552DEC|nr:hypothetical protein [Tateyamaria sp. Alg231-49]
MIKRDNNGQIKASWRRVDTRIQAELLVGDGWEGVAYAELLRLSIEVQAYHSQLDGKPGFSETREAAALLKRAAQAIQSEYDEPHDEDSLL